MIKVLFVCHGNICRSPMAEFIFKKLIKEKGKEHLFKVESRATSSEETGNDIYPEAKRILKTLNVPFESRCARRITVHEFNEFDYVIVMDNNNYYNLSRMFDDPDHKISLLLSYVGLDRDVLDPWYTRNFNDAFKDIEKGVIGFYNYLESNNLI